MARMTKAQRQALASEQGCDAAAQAFFASRQLAQQQAAENAAPQQKAWPWPKGADQAAASDSKAAESETISDEEIAAQQKAAEQAFDKAIQDAMAAADESAAKQGSKRPHIPRSSIARPTKKAWAIYDAMRKIAEENGAQYPSRGECIAEAIRQGIASGTSATQYQYWKKHYGY